MRSIVKLLDKENILVSDGAWGTFLQKKGLAPGECPELWNLTRADDVLDIARSYVDAGSDLIETNSFGGSQFKLALYGLGDKVYEINKAAAEISRKAAGDKCLVMGSIGPTGKMIITGDVTYDELYEAFKVQAMALEEGGADALVSETMSDMEEAFAAVRASRDNTKCEVICTMTFEKSGEDSYHSMMGVTPTQMVQEMKATGVHVLGANCGNGIKDMVGIVKEIRREDAYIPILVHANAGAPIYEDGETIFPETPEQMGRYVGDLLSAGANIVGGCCGTSPEHIKELSRLILELKK